MKNRPNRFTAFLTGLLCAIMCIFPGTATAITPDISGSLSPESNVSTSDRATWYVVSQTAGPGTDVAVDIIVRNPVALSQVNDIGIKVDAPVTITGISPTCPAYDATISSSISGNTIMFDINGSRNASGGVDKGTLFTVYFHVPDNCANGDYNINWISNDMTAFQTNGQAYFPVLREGRITVSGSYTTTSTKFTLPPPRTTTTTTRSTSSTTTTTTTTTVTTTTTNAKFSAKLEIVSLPDQTEYTVGDSLNIKGLTVSAYHIYSDREDLVHYRDLAENYPSRYSVSGYDNSYAHRCRVNITYWVYNDVLSEWVSASDYFYVDIIDSPVTTTTSTTTTTTSTTTTTTTTTSNTTTTTSTGTTTTTCVSQLNMSFRMKNPPTKTTYYVGENFYIDGADFEDLVTFTNKYGFTSNFDYINRSISDLEIDSSRFNPWVPGTYTIYVTDNVYVIDNYGESASGSKTISFEVEVIPKDTTTTSTTSTTSTSTTTSTTASSSTTTSSTSSTTSSSTTTTSTTSTTTSSTTTTTTSTTSSTYTTTTTQPGDKPYIIIDKPTTATVYVGDVIDLEYRFSDNNDFDNNVWFTFVNWNVASLNGNKLSVHSVGTDTLTIHCTSRRYGEITASVVITAAEKNTPDPGFMLGDVTEDGIISGSDATLALMAYTKLSSKQDSGLTEAQFKAADADGDGIITGSDATLILRYYTLLSSLHGSDTLPPMEEWLKTQ